MFLSGMLVGILLIVLMVFGGGEVHGQDYPNRSIRIVSPAAGGGADFTARLVAQGISGSLGQPVVVDNRTAITASEIVFKAPSDGYTVLVAGSSLWISPFLRSVPYDVVSDFAPVSLLERTVNIVAIHPSVPVKSIKELVALAKARPGELNYASASPGSITHLAGELFKSMAGVNIVWIPYTGTAPAITALISGQVQLFIADVGLMAPYVKSGRLRALAVTSAEPSSLTPGLPTVAATLPGYESVSMTCMWVPGKTPKEIIDRLNREVVRYLSNANVKKQFLDAGVEVVGNSPEQFAAIIKSDMARMGKVIKDTGVKVD